MFDSLGEDGEAFPLYFLVVADHIDPYYDYYRPERFPSIDLDSGLWEI